MDMHIPINRNNFTTNNLVSFLQHLEDSEFIANEWPVHVLGDHFNSKEKFYAGNLMELAGKIDSIGVDDIELSFKYPSDIVHGGNTEGQGKFAKIMEDLGAGCSELSSEMGVEFNTHFYLYIKIENRTVFEEWGEDHVCGMTFGGEGSYYYDLEKGTKLLLSWLQNHSPEFSEILVILEKSFGDVKPHLMETLF